MKQASLRIAAGRRLAVAIALLVAAAPAIAHAQASPEAEKLFRDGKAAMARGKIAEACTAFEASEKAEHDVATVLNLADCREKNQQLATAWGLFLAAGSQTRTDPSMARFHKVARQRAAALEPRLSYLTVNVPDESRVDGLVVTRDGVVIPPGAWNRAIPVDGGDHVIAGKAPGHESWSTKVSMAAEGDKQAVEVPKFKELPKLVEPRPELGGAISAGPEPSPFTGRRKIGLGIVAGGVVAAGVGVGFGLSARNLHSDALATCPPSACTPANADAATRLEHKGHTRALIADAAFGVAGAAVIAGAVLWLTGAPHEDGPATEALRVVPQVGDATGFAVVGRF
jgi:hypothetical protein